MSEFDRDPRDRAEGGASNEGPGQATAALEAPPAGSGRRVKRAARTESGEGGDTLHHYIRSIATIPVLSKEESYDLARTMEAETLAFRGALVAMPATAREVLARWHERRRTGHVTAALSAGFRDGSGRNYGHEIDESLTKLDELVTERDAVALSRSGRADRRRTQVEAEITAVLGAAGIAFELLVSIYKQFRELCGAPRGSASALERRRLGLGVPSARSHMARAESALAKLDETKQVFTSHNLKLVVKNAKRYRNMGVPYIDLIQEAVERIVAAKLGQIGLDGSGLVRMGLGVFLQDAGILFQCLLGSRGVEVIERDQPNAVQQARIGVQMRPLKNAPGSDAADAEDLIFGFQEATPSTSMADTVETCHPRSITSR